MLVNGAVANVLNANDRGLAYGDGVFRTLRVSQGRPKSWQLHYKKLVHDCEALGIDCPAEATLSDELQQLIRNQSDCIVKIIVTRGATTRGYPAPSKPDVTRILSIHTLPDYPAVFFERGVSLHLCKFRLAHQPRLAGIKHLNRLENVLAASEWNDPDLSEGILLDIHGNAIGGTRSNLFMLRGGILITPDLTQCGIEGVQRDRVMTCAEQQDMNCRIERISLGNLCLADEIFLVNSAFGLWPVRELPGYRRYHFPVSQRIQEWLNHESD